jgi:hypothetical protein
MGRSVVIKNSFNTGEISGLALGRTDLDKYRNACESLQNYIPLLAGGIQRRPGMRYVANAANQINGQTRLIPFEFSLAQSYMLEFSGNQSLRFYTNNGQVLIGSPAWNPALNGTTVDGSVTWANRFFPQWPGAGQTVAQYTVILDPAGNIQIASTGGTTGSGVIFATGVGLTTNDNTVVWTNAGALAWVPGNAYTAHTSVIYTSAGIMQCTASGTSGSATTTSPYQIPTPYQTDGVTTDLWDLKFAQTGDVMYLVHPKFPVVKLSRLGVTNWIIGFPNFHSPPTHAYDQDISQGTITLTPAATEGASVNFTASAPVFIAGDVGKSIVSGAGLCYISSLGGTTATDGTTGATLYQVAVCSIIDAFASTAAIGPGGTWALRGSPQSYGGYGNLSAGNWQASRKFGAGTVQTFYCFQKSPVDGSSAPSQEDTFRVIDIGRYIVQGGAVGLIVSLAASSASIANVQTFAPITSTGANSNGVIVAQSSSGGAWDVEDRAFLSMFGGLNGYPAAVCFFQDRLMFAGIAALPQNVWGSVTGDYENFAKGPLDNQALDFGLASGRLENIVAVIGFGGVLLIHTLRSEYAVGAGAVPTISGNSVPLAGILSPSNVTALKQSEYGTDRIQPIQVDSEIIYVKRSKQASGAMAFNIQTSNYATRNLTVMCELIAPAGLKEMTYQEFPSRVLWFTDLAGNLVSLTYEHENDVWAWARHFTGIYGADGVVSDQVISICAITDPTLITDQAWVCCKRTLSGVTQYTIERMDPTLFVDCGLQQNFGAAETTIGNLAYLTGRQIVVQADGAVIAGPGGDTTTPPSGPIMTAGGIYNFPRGLSGRNIQVGLPILCTAVTVRPEPGGAQQTIQGLQKRWARLFARVYQSVQLLFNAKRIGYRSQENSTGAGAPALVASVGQDTGDMRLEANLDYDRDGRVTIQQDQPLPSTVLAVFGTLSVGED